MSDSDIEMTNQDSEDYEYISYEDSDVEYTYDEDDPNGNYDDDESKQNGSSSTSQRLGPAARGNLNIVF